MKVVTPGRVAQSSLSFMCVSLFGMVVVKTADGITRQIDKDGRRWHSQALRIKTRLLREEGGGQ